jgi:hypothetical protein
MWGDEFAEAGHILDWLEGNLSYKQLVAILPWDDSRKFLEAFETRAGNNVDGSRPTFTYVPTVKKETSKQPIVETDPAEPYYEEVVEEEKKKIKIWDHAEFKEVLPTLGFPPGVSYWVKWPIVDMDPPAQSNPYTLSYGTQRIRCTVLESGTMDGEMVIRLLPLKIVAMEESR